ncbi:FabD lysophospholipase-like protein [Coniophora puteana RWD-64-598 SS2]|uniref:FabD lysophospholipase-like protein n=1 Tax=Coniophora puteana (strain RWD-64-598) TaxID=741705 RepID=A0A5M3MQU9_CONPW|nr:FabD lysophospholipase-like protein [Coniophora puteana RWD-64-598 SS2]EIW81553.1 FabD lysophospholipase-like protein [Coniophora puteana RWD-64-598 SS2]
MHRIQVSEGPPSTPLPCEYFDLIGGTDIGGLAVLMFGRLRMPIDDAIAAFSHFVDAVWARGRKHRGEDKFKASKLEKVIKDIVKAASGDVDALMVGGPADRDGDVGHDFVCAMLAGNQNTSIFTLFRTYVARTNPSPDCAVWEAVYATMALPGGHFKPASITTRGMSQHYIGGAMGANNPARRGLREAEALFPTDHLAILISIGTGHPGTTTVAGDGGTVGAGDINAI